MNEAAVHVLIVDWAHWDQIHWIIINPIPIVRSYVMVFSAGFEPAIPTPPE